MILKFLSVIFFIQCAQSVEIRITNKWGEGFYGQIILHPDHILHGWKFKVKFSSPIERLEFWTADVAPVNQDKTEFLVTNKVYNGDILTTQNYVISFIGHQKTTTDATPTASIEDLLNGSQIKEQTTESSSTTVQVLGSTNAVTCVDNKIVNCNPSVCSNASLKTFCPFTCNTCASTNKATIKPTIDPQTTQKSTPLTTRWFKIDGK